MEGDPSTGTIAGNVTQYEKSCLEWEVSPGVFQPWPPEGTQDPDWCWLHTATEGGTLVATACLIPQVFRDLLLEATKGTSTLAPSQFTYNRPRAKKGASGSIVDISSDLITKIKSKRPETVGAGRPILLIVKPEFEGGKTVSLRYTPDWRRPYQAVITAACGVNQQTIGEFHGIPRTIYLADGSLSPGYWPLHNSQDPSDRSAWTEALARVQCAPLFQEQVDDLGATSAGWIPDLTPGQDARLWPVTVVTLLGTQGIVIGASLALTITQPMFHEADQVPLLNTTSGRRWGSVPYE